VFAARRLGGRRVVALDGAPRLGAKILVSGGSRCNLTNARVCAEDFCGGSRPFVRRVIESFGVEETVAFFAELGVTVKEEEHGKLFPRSGRARAILDALVGECARLGAPIETRRRVEVIEVEDGGFSVVCRGGEAYEARRVILATGGLSLPKSGSDGAGLALARRLGHRVIETTPALVPLVLGRGFHGGLSGLAVDAELALHSSGRKPIRVRGAVLFTHFGLSGPAVLDISRHFLRAKLEGASPRLRMSVIPGWDFQSAEEWLLVDRSGRRVGSSLARAMPERLADALCRASGVAPETASSRLDREARRSLVRSLVEIPLDVVGSRGYAAAEATAGGVCLGEVVPATLESRLQAGLHFAGEVLDVDGRLGGFNFQWAWSSAWVAAHGVAAGLVS
jgi:hypothetical protein